MNVKRRKQLDVVHKKLSELLYEIEGIQGEETAYFERIPANFQNTQKYAHAETTVTTIEELVDNINNALLNIEEAKAVYEE